jgi:hypothetical protein
MREARAIADGRSMAETQGATPPAWLGRSRWRLLGDVVGGFRQNWDKLCQLISMLAAYFRPGLVRRRLERLRALGHQMIVSAAAETKLFYRSQGIPWVFHNARRFVSGPATMLDPIGLFAPRDAIVHHVLQTFHRHPLYDLVLLRAHVGGVEAMAAQARQMLDGTHPHRRALASLIEDGAYHERLPRDIAAFQANPLEPARPIPAGLVDDPELMLAMDQFKDVRGFARYAARLRVGIGSAIRAWLAAGFDETFGELFGRKLGPRRVRREACDPEIVARYPLPA